MNSLSFTEFVDNMLIFNCLLFRIGISHTTARDGTELPVVILDSLDGRRCFMDGPPVAADGFSENSQTQIRWN